VRCKEQSLPRRDQAGRGGSTARERLAPWRRAARRTRDKANGSTGGMQHADPTTEPQVSFSMGSSSSSVALSGFSTRWAAHGGTRAHANMRTCEDEHMFVLSTCLSGITPAHVCLASHQHMFVSHHTSTCLSRITPAHVCLEHMFVSHHTSTCICHQVPHAHTGLP
jgi:hypothetical protein